MYFPSDCDVAAAVRLKCISANSCAIRGERGRRSVDGLPWWNQVENGDGGGWVTKSGMEGERCMSEKASECGKKVRETEKKGNRDGAIFQAIYCNHHSLINQAFHHRTTQSLLLALSLSLHLHSATHSQTLRSSIHIAPSFTHAYSVTSSAP